jgi:heme exporter protein A
MNCINCHVSVTDWIVDAQKVGKTFAWTPVLHEVSCQVRAGEIVSFFGPNGAGKTTLLRILATLLQPTAGAVRLFGLSAADPAARRQLGFLGHESFLYPDLTPVENLTFYGRAYRVTNAPAKIEALLEQVGLYQWRQTPVRVFSRGMEQRLSLARTLLHDPDLLLLDEPYTGLDTQGINTLQAVLVRGKEAGKTIVLTTHDFHLGLELGTRAFILHRGRIAWESTGQLPPVREFTEIYHATTQDSVLSTQHSQ